MASPSPLPSAERDLAGHMPPLDGVRGVAILLVLINNLYPGYPSGFVDRLFYIASNTGWTGVDLFFVLSGFLITGILWDSKHGEGYFRNFYLRRILRIFPLYYGFLLLWSLAAPVLFPDPAGVASWEASRIWYWTYLANIYVALGGSGPLQPGHFWSLAVEEQFYLLWPLVVLVCSERRLVRVCLAMIVSAFLLRLVGSPRGYEEALYVLTPARMDALATGALLAILARRPGGVRRLARWARWVFPAGLACLFGMFVLRKGLQAGDVVVQTAGYSLLALTAGAGLVLAVAAAPGSFGYKLTTHPWLAALGRYSYGIYVWSIIPRLTWSWEFVQHPPPLMGYEFPTALLIWLCLSAVAVLLGYASFHLIERPFLRLKDRFPYHRAPPVI